MNNIFTFYYALKDGRTPWYAKLTALLSLIYLVSPADIVPDIIPLAGYIDDVVVVPFLINIATKLLPADVRLVAEQRAIKNKRKLLWAKIGLVVLAIAVMVGLFFLATRIWEAIK